MFAFLIVAVFVGIGLGLRFNIFVLVPAILIGIVLITLSNIATRQGTGVILVTAFASVVLLQIGYIAGRVLKVASQTHSSTWTLTGQRPPKSELTKSTYRTNN